MVQTAVHGSPDSLRFVTCAQHEPSLTWTPMSGVLWQRPTRQHSAASTDIAPSCRRHGICLHQRQKHAQGWHSGGHCVGRWQHSSCSSYAKEQTVVCFQKGRAERNGLQNHPIIESAMFKCCKLDTGGVTDLGVLYKVILLKMVTGVINCVYEFKNNNINTVVDWAEKWFKPRCGQSKEGVLAAGRGARTPSMPRYPWAMYRLP